MRQFRPERPIISSHTAQTRKKQHLNAGLTLNLSTVLSGLGKSTKPGRQLQHPPIMQPEQVMMKTMPFGKLHYQITAKTYRQRQPSSTSALQCPLSVCALLMSLSFPFTFHTPSSSLFLNTNLGWLLPYFKSTA